MTANVLAAQSLISVVIWSRAVHSPHSFDFDELVGQLYGIFCKLNIWSSLLIKAENRRFTSCVAKSIPRLIGYQFAFHLVNLGRFLFQLMLVPNDIELIDGHITIFSKLNMVFFLTVRPAL